MLTVLINEQAAQPDRVLLVLVDYHLVDARPVHASVGFLLEHHPPGLRLLLASRADPPLPLAMLRARGQLGPTHDPAVFDDKPIVPHHAVKPSGGPLSCDRSQAM